MTDTLSEEEVDEELTSYLQKPIEKKKRTFSETFQEEETEEEDPEETQPCTKETRDNIYNLWSQAWDENGEKLLPLVQKVSAMSESQAKAYLQCLKAIHSRSMHKHLSEKILYFLANLICHPLDITTPIAIQEDEYLKTGTSLWVSDLLSLVGKVGTILLLFAYGGLSRYSYRETPFEKNKRINTTEEKKCFAQTPIPTNGVCESGNGENNVNDKIND